MVKNMKKSLPFRAWFYFRQGWATYFAFIFAAINTMVVTYYLAIEKLPVLNEIFPSFGLYLVTLSILGIPLLILVGYAHYKRTPAFSEEIEVSYLSNPYLFKIAPGWNMEVVFPFYLLVTNILMKISKNEKLSDEEVKELNEIQKNLKDLLKGEYIGDYRKNTRSKKKS